MKKIGKNKVNRKITLPESLVRMIGVTVFAIGVLLATSCQMNMNKQDKTAADNSTHISD